MSKPALILLVEDNKMDVELTLDAFREARVANKIDVCNDGQSALDYLLAEGAHANRRGAALPDLILLDLKLPGMSGHEVLRRIKSSPNLKRVPVVILSSSKEEADRALGYDLGTNSYLVKPVSFEAFLEVVRELEDYWLTLNVGPPPATTADD